MKDSFTFSNTITPEEYMVMRQAVGWREFPLEEAKAGLSNSYIWCIRDEGNPVALGRAIWDQGYVVYIADVIVLPEYQGQGLGREIMENIMVFFKSRLKPGYRMMISLVSAKGKDEFYEKFGFTNRPNDDLGPGMSQWIASDS